MNPTDKILILLSAAMITMAMALLFQLASTRGYYMLPETDWECTAKEVVMTFTPEFDANADMTGLAREESRTCVEFTKVRR